MRDLPRCAIFWSGSNYRVHKYVNIHLAVHLSYVNYTSIYKTTTNCSFSFNNLRKQLCFMETLHRKSCFLSGSNIPKQVGPYSRHLTWASTVQTRLEFNGEANGSAIYTNGFHVPHTVFVMTSHSRKFLQGRLLLTIFSRWENWSSQQLSSFPHLTQLLRDSRPGTQVAFCVDINPWSFSCILPLYKRGVLEGCDPAGEISMHILFLLFWRWLH